MSAILACLGGSALYRLAESGQVGARALGSRQTPYGPSGPIFLAEQSPAPFYLVPRYPPGRQRPAPGQINYRAIFYALKDLEVQAVLSWSAAGAITHNLSLGQVAVPDDLLDMTSRRCSSFYEKSALGCLRQFPVFCPQLCRALEDALVDMRLPHQSGGTVAVAEGPRLETPAEIRMLATCGAELVAHTLAPEAFLAKELQMCLAGAFYLVNYAETGSWHRPFTTGDLFGGLSQASGQEKIRRTADALPELLTRLAGQLAQAPQTCDCGKTMAYYAQTHQLGADWRGWLDKVD
jgi:5'-methylthioadenosine phosphorylase